VRSSIKSSSGRSFESQVMRSREGGIKSDLVKGALGLLLLGVGAERGFCLGFTNLNFESAHVSGYPVNAMGVPISAALPGWNASFSNATSGTLAASQVWYDGLSGGGSAISINDTNTGFGFVPLQGKYSAMLFGGGPSSNSFYSATISQTGIVPTGTESLQVQIGNYGDAFIVSLSGETINMVPLATFAHYTLYGGDVSTFAGQLETLSFTAPPAAVTQPSFLEVDNILFSTSPVPEPGTLALAAMGAVLLGMGRGRKGLT
jgi:hypothetical protein